MKNSFKMFRQASRPGWFAIAALGALSAVSLSACVSDSDCYDQFACGSASRGVVMALPEFTIPSLAEMAPDLELSSDTVRSVLNAAGVSDSMLDSLGVDLSDIDAVLAALSSAGVSIPVDGIVEDLLLSELAQLETAVNAQINASMPEGGTASVELLGVEDLVVSVDPTDLQGSIQAALDQLSIRAALRFPIPTLEEMMNREGPSPIDVETVTSVVESIEISELGLRTLAPTEAAVVDVKLLNPTSKQAALRSTCEAGQPKFDLLESLSVKLQQNVAGSSNQTLFSYNGSSGNVCGVVLKAKTPVDLLDSMVTGATLTLDLTTGFPSETSRMLPVGKIKFTGSLELPGTVQTLIKALSGK